MNLPSYGGRALHNGRRFGYNLRKGVRLVPIIITLHILGFTVTVRIKGRNRHPGR